MFGWRQDRSVDMGPAGTYLVFGHADEPADVSLGGMFNPDAMATPPFWLYYINVDDIDQAVARIRDGGGRIMNGPNEVPGGGMVASCKDPQGCRFAVFAQPKGQGG
ncbi:MAG: VOC family protein [Gemmatimonadota bacterium]